MPVIKSPAENTSHRPSADHCCKYVFPGPGRVERSNLNSSSSGALTVNSFVYTFQLPNLLELKASRVPSGDQTGLSTSSGSKVSRVLIPLARSKIHKLAFRVWRSKIVIAICLALGDRR